MICASSKALAVTCSVGHVNATDMDEPNTPNAQVHYRLLSNSDISHRRCRRPTENCCSSSLSAGRFDEIVAMATRRSIRSGHARLKSNAIVNVTIGKKNTNAPTIIRSRSILAVTQATAVNTTLFEYTATDDDNDTVTYTLRGAGHDSEQMFTVDELSGSLRTRSTVTESVGTANNVTLTATEDGVPRLTSERTVVIIVCAPKRECALL
ncbi:unnamed protein product [Sphagnum balticum]